MADVSPIEVDTDPASAFDPVHHLNAVLGLLESIREAAIAQPMFCVMFPDLSEMIRGADATTTITAANACAEVFMRCT